MKEFPHSRNLRLHRLSDTPATFFVTKSLLPKKPVLDADRRQIIVSAFEYALRDERIYLRAFVVMPDHWHALFALREPWTLPKFMHSLMSHVAAKTSAHLYFGGSEWQDTYYETRIRTARQFRYVAYYIEQNPVKKELVVKPEDWSASSAARTDLVTEPWPWLYEHED
ncbi:MAG: REP-associated tyrosine transposase [Verrucomicrobiota bacterium]